MNFPPAAASLGGAQGTDASVTDASVKHRVLIADDHPLILAGVRAALSQADDIEIVGEAYSGPQVLAMIERRRPTLVLLDYRMPGVSGTDCIAEIAARWPGVKTVVMSACDSRADIDAALDAGACAYVIKTVSGFDIASVVRQTSAGGVFHATSRPRAGVREAASEPGRSDGLTERELSILGAIASGCTTSEISQRYWVSEHTVKFHLTNIYRKLGVRNRAGAIRYALEHGVNA